MSATEQSSQAEAMRLLKVLYDHDQTSSDPVFVERSATHIGLTEREAQRAWRYLKDKGLIETFDIAYTARINASGIDAIEEVRQHPDRSAPSFPAVTYNIVNNSTTIGTAVNSPVQQTAGSVPPASSQVVATKKTLIERLTSRTTALSALLIAIAGLLGTIPKIQETATKAYCSLVPCGVTSVDVPKPAPPPAGTPSPIGLPETKKFSYNDFVTKDGGGNKSGTISKINVSVVDNKGQGADAYVAEWTWSGTGGTQHGSQTVVIDLKSATGATLESLMFLLDRTHCYYQGNPQRSGNLKRVAGLVTRIDVTVTAVEGTQDPC